jgi:hypothetical protein
MPDIICHGVQGGLIVAAPLLSRLKRRKWIWSIVVFGVFLGALPDLIGAHGNFVEYDNWGEYVLAHQGEIADVFKYVPMYGLHLFLDRYTHGEGIRWWVAGERLWLETVLWFVNFIAIWWMVRKWMKN